MNTNWVSILCLIQFLNNVYTRSIDNTPLVEDIQQNAYAEVTYPGIGHFTTRDFYDPIYRPIVFLPKSPEQISTRFLLHTRKNLNNAQVLKVGDQGSIRSSNFNAKSPTKFIVHGFIDNQLFGEWMRHMKDEFLMADDQNVIIVDWSKGNGLPYGQATANTRVVGPVIALLINDLKTVSGLDLNNVHILGHSLGSHVAGYAGEKMNGQVGRITGLDPAGPYFEGLKDPASKLDPTDAQFVDAIHSDAQHLIPHLGFGMYETSGHLDFYPNGGKNQPGCDQERWTSIITEGLLEGVRRLVACNHQRAVDFYLTSINHKHNKGVSYQCQDYESFENGHCVDCGTGNKCAILGDDANQSRQFEKATRGTRFFLATTDKYPYFTNEYEIQIKMSEPADHKVSNHGLLTVTIQGENSKEKVTLNPKDEIFRLGQSYSYIKNIGYDLGDIKSVTFHWHRALGGLIKQQMWIDSITVVPLSSKNVLNREQHLKEIKTFCTNNRNEGLKNENDYQFSVVCK